MSNFQDIPISDITYLLNYYNQPITDNLYLNAWNFIISNPKIVIPVAIADWVIAHTNTKLLPTMKLSSIIFASKEQLDNLKLLTSDKTRLARIFKYANKLIEDNEFLNNLPDEVIICILENTDCDSYQNLCSLSTRFNKFCNKNTLSNILNRTTKFNTSTFTKNQLLNLCSMKEYNDVLVQTDDDILKIDNNGFLYKNNVLIYNKEKFVTISDNAWYHNKAVLLNDKGEVFIYTENNGIPVQKLEDKNIIQALMTNDDLYILATDKKVYHYNEYTEELESVNNLTNVIKFNINGYFELFLSEDGTLFGKNPTTKLIEQLSDNKFVDFKINTSLYALALSIDGNVYYIDWSYVPHFGNVLKFIETPALTNIIKIHVAEYFSVAVDKNNNLYMLGESTITRYNRRAIKKDIKVKHILGSTRHSVYIIKPDNKNIIYSRVSGTDTIEEI